MAQSSKDAGKDGSRVSGPLPTIPDDDGDGTSYPNSRQRFVRQSSWAPAGTLYQHLSPDDQDIAEAETESHRESKTHGLGLSGIPEPTASSTVKRVAVGSKDKGVAVTEHEIAQTPAPSSGIFSQATTAYNTPGRPETSVKFTSTKSSHTSLRDDAYQHYPDDVRLIDHASGIDCSTRGDLLKSHWSWFSITIILLSVYSTFFSGVFLGIAMAKPRWGEKIGTQGHLSFATASLLSAMFSKTVELSFATVFVAALGQILSHKAFIKTYNAKKGGISIAEMNMRLWIMQPGTLITNWYGVRYAATTILGILALLAAMSAAFYTTAAEALVSPKLKFGRNESVVLSGLVTASYANSKYLADQCQTPINPILDPEVGTTCLQIEHAGQAYHNFDSWLMNWASLLDRGQNIDTHGVLDGRPPPVAILYDNTTVLGQFISPAKENITHDSEAHKRLVQNITMVMPHTNVFHAVRDPVNHILQPGDLQGAGEYYVRAAVAAPALNVQCAGLSSDELQPFIYKVNSTEPEKRVFETVLDQLFNWTQNTPQGNEEYAPWFTNAPIEYNTVVNVTEGYGPAAIYLLAKPPNSISDGYVLCSIKSLLYPDCTTSYHVAQSGGQLTVHCDSDPGNSKPYNQSLDKPAPNNLFVKDWKDVGGEWIKALALPQGVTNSNASISRIITQMIPAYSSVSGVRLDPGLPSIGEALSVLAGCTLLLSSDAAPFVHFWNYSRPVLEEPQYQNFNATLSYKDFASGGTQSWQGIFYIILLAVFALNVFCLIYLFWLFSRYGQVTDYTEPQNLFALAINSPQSGIMAGACGGGPSGDMLRKRWTVNMSTHRTASTPNLNANVNTPDIEPMGRTTSSYHSPHPHFYVSCPDDNNNNSHPFSSQTEYQSPTHTHTHPHRYSHPLSTPNPMHQVPRPSQTFSQRLSSKFSDLNLDLGLGLTRRSQTPSAALRRPRSVHDFSVEMSPAVQQYERLAGRM